MDVRGRNLLEHDVREYHKQLRRIKELEERRDHAPNFTAQEAELLARETADLRRKLDVAVTMDADDASMDSGQMDRVLQLKKWYGGPKDKFTVRAAPNISDKSYNLFEYVVTSEEMIASRRVSQTVRNDQFGHYTERKDV